MQIGPYTLSNPWILVPMDGVSEMPFRVIARHFRRLRPPPRNWCWPRACWVPPGADGAVSQARRRDRATVLGADVRRRCRIHGRGGEEGCGAGGTDYRHQHGLPGTQGDQKRRRLRPTCDPVRAAKIVEAVGQAGGVPVTAKIRAGWDHFSLNFKEMAKALSEAGCAALAMHARTRAQGYSGHADWSLIAQLVQATSMPVIGNGDIKTPADAAGVRRGAPPEVPRGPPPGEALCGRRYPLGASLTLLQPRGLHSGGLGELLPGHYLQKLLP